jgi:hypothetical protein
MAMKKITSLMVAAAAIALSACSNVRSSGTATHPALMAWDGLGVHPSASPKRALRRLADAHASLVTETHDETAKGLLPADGSDEQMSERKRYEKMDRVLTICRGC